MIEELFVDIWASGKFDVVSGYVDDFFDKAKPRKAEPACVSVIDRVKEEVRDEVKKLEVEIRKVLNSFSRIEQNLDLVFGVTAMSYLSRDSASVDKVTKELHFIREMELGDEPRGFRQGLGKIKQTPFRGHDRQKLEELDSEVDNLAEKWRELARSTLAVESYGYQQARDRKSVV